ncbi:TolC family protein [Burkholderia multivorans]|uniref:TolC family protein n=1 Tax=Burkholderia multivorans TaxID=87883 RepID=UPI001C26D75C|nr:TolC family protein [Burkholderia multivorans]MBU9564502.1 TolC family protein [Burkholderia multivorans]
MGFGAALRDLRALRWRHAIVALALCQAALPTVFAQTVAPVWDLAQTIDHVETANAGYAAARAEYRAAQQAVPEAMAGLLPRVALSGKMQKGSTLVGESTGAKDFHTNGFTLSLTQPLINIGQWQTVDEAKLGEARDAISLAEAHQNVLADATSAYIDVLAAQARQRAAAAHRAALAEALESARHAFQLGVVTVVEVDDARARLARSDADLAEFENDIEIAMSKLRKIAGDDSITVKPLPFAWTLRPVLPGALSNLLERAEEENLGVARSRLETRIADKKIKEARSEFLPTVELVLSHSRGSATYLESQTNILLGRAGHSDAIGIQISVPIFDGFSTLAKTRQRLDEKDSADNKLVETIRAVRQQTRQAYLTLTSSLSRVHALSEAIHAAVTARDAARKAYTLGVKINVDVLDAEDRLYAAQTDSIRATFDALQSEIKLKWLTADLTEYYVAELNRAIYEGTNAP